MRFLFALLLPWLALALTASRTVTPTKTCSRTSTPTRTASQTGTPSRTASRTGTPSRTASRTGTPTRSATRTPRPIQPQQLSTCETCVAQNTNYCWLAIQDIAPSCKAATTIQTQYLASCSKDCSPDVPPTALHPWSAFVNSMSASTPLGVYIFIPLVPLIIGLVPWTGTTSQGCKSKVIIIVPIILQLLMYCFCRRRLCGEAKICCCFYCYTFCDPPSEAMSSSTPSVDNSGAAVVLRTATASTGESKQFTPAAVTAPPHLSSSTSTANAAKGKEGEKSAEAVAGASAVTLGVEVTVDSSSSGDQPHTSTAASV